MKASFNQRYHKICALAEYQAKHFAEAVSESFEDLDGLGEFVDTMFYIHSITDDEQFAVFLGMMYEVLVAKCLKQSTATSLRTKGQAYFSIAF